MTTRSGEKKLNMWIAVGIIVALPSAAAALAPGGGVVPPDESAAVSQMIVNPMTGELLLAAPNARDQGATDNSAAVAATVILGYVLVSAPPTSSDQGATDNSVAVAATGILGNVLVSAPPNSSDQGATDFSPVVPDVSLDPVDGTLFGAPLRFFLGISVPGLFGGGLLLLAALLSVLALLFIRRSAFYRASS